MSEHTGFGKLSIKGYRRLLDVTVDFTDRPLAVVVGANGSGKTSLLEVFSLLAAAASGHLREEISSLGGFSEILTRGKVSSIHFDIDTQIEVSAKDTENQYLEPIHYHLTLDTRSVGYKIAGESLSISVSDNNIFISSRVIAGKEVLPDSSRELLATAPTPDTWNDSLESKLSEVSRDNREATTFKGYLESCVRYGVIDVRERSALRLPQKLEPADLPGRNGEMLLSCLYSMRENLPERYEVLEDTLRAAFPNYQTMGFPPVAAGSLSLTWRDKHFDKPFYINELSEGTLRFLWLITTLLSPKLPKLLLIDEPEVSLHPELMELLVDTMREAARHSQVIVATHSDILLRFLKPQELLICDMDEAGAARMTWADQIPDVDLERWMRDYTLDELWSMNVLGGRSGEPS